MQKRNLPEGLKRKNAKNVKLTWQRWLKILRSSGNLGDSLCFTLLPNVLIKIILYTVRAWVRYNISITILHRKFTRFSWDLKIPLKHSSFWPLAYVKPASNDQMHAMP